MSDGMKIDDWLEGERDGLTDELEAALAPRRPDPEAFGAGVRERIRGAEAGERADEERADEGDGGALRMERAPARAITGGLGWAAGLVPPMLLSKGASKVALGAGTAVASKAGAKLTLKAAPAVAALPAFALFMIVASLVYAVRGWFSSGGDGGQRTDDDEARYEMRQWWVNNRLPALMVGVVVIFVSIQNLARGWESPMLLVLMGSTIAAVGLLGRLSAAGLATRQQVAKLMGSFVSFSLPLTFQAPQFISVPGSASAAWPIERVTPFLVVPMVLMTGSVCWAVAMAAPGQVRRAVTRALVLGVAFAGVLGGLWAQFGPAEYGVEDVQTWVAEGTEPQLAEAGRWAKIGQALRMMDAAGAPLPDLEAFQEVAHRTMAREGEEFNSLDLLPLLQMDRSLGTRFAAADELPDVIREELEERRDRVDVTERVVINSDDFEATSLLSFRELARYDEFIVARVRLMRSELEPLRGVEGQLDGADAERRLRWLSVRCGDEAFERTWSRLLVAPSLDIAGVVSAGRAEMVERILRGAPAPDRPGVLSDYLNAATMLEFVGAPEAVASMVDRVHRAILDTWVLRDDRRIGAFRGSVDEEDRADDGATLSRYLFSGSIDTTASAVEAMARWGLPAAPADGSRPGIDLLALEAYLVENARVYGLSSHSVLAVAALARLHTLPEFQAQLEARQASTGLLDVLSRMSLFLAAFLCCASAIGAMIVAPPGEDPVEGAPEEPAAGQAAGA